MFSKLLTKRSASLESRKRKQCLKKFLYYFPNGFADETYKAWERNYKWDAHKVWEASLNKQEYERLLADKE